MLAFTSMSPYPILTFSSHSPWPSLIQVETQSFFQIPHFSIVGLPNVEVHEARERVRSALIQSQFDFPKRRIVVNLSPADIPKFGTGMDLSIALSILVAHATPALRPQHPILAWGELSLCGKIRSTGEISTRLLFVAHQHSIQKLIFPSTEESQIQNRLMQFLQAGYFSKGIPQLCPVDHLQQAWKAVQRSPLSPKPIPIPSAPLVQSAEINPPHQPLLSLPPSLLRPMMIAAVGHHHLLLLGEKGAGKSQSVEWMNYLFEAPTPAHGLESRLLHELVEHHSNTASASSLIHTGTHCRVPSLIGSLSKGRFRPGLYTLAHGKILVADELPEWDRDCRESLREPLENRSVFLSRTGFNLHVPAHFQLIATGNLCPCGKKSTPHSNENCKCKPTHRQAYLKRLSGPLLDRIDLIATIRCELSKIPEFKSDPSEIKKQVHQGREFARVKWGAIPSLLSNESVEKQFSKLPDTAFVFESGSLRSRHKIMKIALSIAALEAEEHPKIQHLLEASCYRSDRYDWI